MAKASSASKTESRNGGSVKIMAAAKAGNQLAIMTSWRKLSISMALS